MCRWLAYSGSPISLEQLLYTPVHSLIDQSLHSELGAETTNGDGFGMGWYDGTDEPGLFRSIEPAWNDVNLREIARHTWSPTVLAHIRASSGSPVQLTNCHPFRHGNWLFMHNGVIRDYLRVKRDLVLEIDPALYPSIGGSTDSETLFYLALTYGLQADPVDAMERAVGFVEYVGARHGVDRPIQMTVATTDGTSIWTFRYSSESDSRTLFFSTKIDSLRQLYPDNELFRSAGDETRLIVSEPLSPLPGAWNAVPESTCAIIRPGDDELRPFTPQAPGTRAHNGRSAVATRPSS